MNWLTETSVRNGSQDYLTGAVLTDAGRLGAALDSGIPLFKEREVFSSLRLAYRAGNMNGPGTRGIRPTEVSEMLADEILDLGMFGSADLSPTALRALLARSAGEISTVVLVHDSGKWNLVFPTPVMQGVAEFEAAVQPLRVRGLERVPSTDLAPLLHAILDHSEQIGCAAVTLRLTPTQLDTITHPLLDLPGTRIELVVPSSVRVDVIARMVRRRPRLTSVDLELDGQPATIAVASLVATLCADADRISLRWAKADEPQVSTGVLPQLRMAFRGCPAFATWQQENRTQQLLAFAMVTNYRAGRSSVLASRAELIPAGLAGTDALIFASDDLPDLGQSPIVLHGSTFPDAAALSVGDLTLEFRQYGDPTPPGEQQLLLRHLADDSDVDHFLADAHRARVRGEWISARLSALEDDDAWLLGQAGQPISGTLFIDYQGVRSRRRAQVLPVGFGADEAAAAAAIVGERREPGCPGLPIVIRQRVHQLATEMPWLESYVTALRLRSQYGDGVRISGFPAPLFDSDSADLAGTAGSTPQGRTPQGSTPQWVVAQDQDRTFLAEVGGGRRVFAVQPWGGAAVEAVQSGVSAADAVELITRRHQVGAAAVHSLLAEVTAERTPLK